MKVIKPLDTPCNNVLYSNVAQSVPTWDIAITYSKGEQVVAIGDTCGSTVYESLDNSNTGNDPATTPLSWLAIGVSNYWALFDDKNSSQTVSGSSLEYVISFPLPSIVDSVSLVDIVGTEVLIEMWEDGLDWTVDTPTFTSTINLRDYGTTSWADYLLYQVSDKESITKIDLPIFVGGTGRVVISGSTQTKIGSLVYGRVFPLGDSLYGFQASIKDYSYKEVDDFGNRTIIERESRDLLTINTIVPSGFVTQAMSLLNDYRAKPLVWVGDENKEVTQVYGFYTSASFTENSPAYSELALQLEEL